MIQSKAICHYCFLHIWKLKTEKKIILRENFKANSDRQFDVQLGYDYSSETETCIWNYVYKGLHCMYFQQLKNHSIVTIKS